MKGGGPEQGRERWRKRRDPASGLGHLLQRSGISSRDVPRPNEFFGRGIRRCDSRGGDLRIARGPPRSGTCPDNPLRTGQCSSDNRDVWQDTEHTNHRAFSKTSQDAPHLSECWMATVELLCGHEPAAFVLGRDRRGPASCCPGPRRLSEGRTTESWGRGGDLRNTQGLGNLLRSPLQGRDVLLQLGDPGSCRFGLDDRRQRDPGRSGRHTGRRRGRKRQPWNWRPGKTHLRRTPRSGTRGNHRRGGR